MLELKYTEKICKTDVKSLVFSGGGAAGLAYAGVIEELEKQGILHNIKTVAGASAGAIIALVFALGYTTPEIIEIIKKTNFKNFLDCGEGYDLNKIIRNPTAHPMGVAHLIERLLIVGALCDGKFAKKFLEGLIERKDYSRNITFQHLFEKTGIKLNIVCCDISRKQTRTHNHHNSPALPVLEAVLTSMSIPFVFKTVDLYGDKSCCVDGGTTDNYPLTCVENPLGFILDTKEEVLNPKFTKITWLGEYILAMISMLRGVNYDTIFSKQENINHTVFIDTKGVGALDFDLTPDKISELIESGRKSVQEYFTE